MRRRGGIKETNRMTKVEKWQKIPSNLKAHLKLTLIHRNHTPRSGLAKEKKMQFYSGKIGLQISWHLAHFYFYITKRSIFQLIWNPNMPGKNLVFSFAILLLGVRFLCSYPIIFSVKKNWKSTEGGGREGRPLRGFRGWKDSLIYY